MNSEDEHITPDSDGFTSSEDFEAMQSQMMLRQPEADKSARKLTANPDQQVRLKTTEMDHLPRTPLKDKYEFLSVLGAGGAGVIYKAKQQPLGRLVAVKMIHSHLMTPTAVKRFQVEATTIAKISHPNIISVYDFGISEENQPFMVMDYAEGTPLSEQLDQEGQLSVETTKSIARQLCDGLAHAHAKGILHRDLKPSNIMMVKSEHGPEIAKILDFGLAKVIFGEEDEDEPEHLTKTGETVGTPAFMSPEQVMGKGLDQKSDIYALGCVMYHCLTGEPPFVGETKMETMLMHLNSTPEPINPSEGEPLISPYLEMVIMKSLEKLPEDRFESMMDMKAAIDATDKGLFLTPSVSSAPSADQIAPGRTGASKESPTVAKSNPVAIAAKPLITTRALLVVLIIMGAVAIVFVLADAWINAYPSEDNQVAQKAKPKKTAVFDEDSWYDDAFKGRIDPKSHHISAHHDPEISDKGLKALKGNQSVRTIDMSEAHKVSEKGISYLKGNFIQVLNLQKTQVHDSVKKYLPTMVGPDGAPSLVDLNLGETPITDEIIPTLTELPKLEAVDLSVNKNITNAGVAALANTGIKRLNLSKTKVDDQAMKAIASIKGLISLDLSGTQVTDVGVRELINLPKLQELKLADTRVTDESIKRLATLKNLTVLNVARTQVSDVSLPLILKYAQLAYVNISGCLKITPTAGTDFTHEMQKEGRTAEKNETTAGE